MAVDRNKILQSAEKYVRQGKIDQAISAYEQLMQLTPRDMNLKNKVGDLLIQAGSLPEAIRVWTEVADFYSEEGFYLKGIAVLKKISRHVPTSVEHYFKLADLYQKQGLNNDAKSQYLQVADLFAKEGQTSRAIEAIEQLLKIDPENLKARNRLAESYAKEGKTEKALGEYRIMGEELAKKSMYEEAAKVLERGLAMDDSHAELVAGLCRVLFDAGRFQELIERARGLYPKHRENAPMLALLGDAYLRTRQADAARQVFEKLVALDPANIDWKARLEELQSAGPARSTPVPERSRSGAPIPDFSEMSGDYSMEELGDVSGEFPAGSDLAPDGAEGGTATETAAGPDAERAEFIVEHVTEAEVFIKYGLVEKAIENLEAIVSRYPDEADSLRRLKDLYLESGNKGRAAEKCVELAKLARTRGEMQKAMDLLAEARAHDPAVRVDRPGGVPTAAPPEPTPAVDTYAFGEGSGPVELDSGPPSSGIELDFGAPAERERPGQVASSGVSLDFGETAASPGGDEAIEFSVDEAGGEEDGGATIEFEEEAAGPEPSDGDLAEIDFYSEQGFADQARSRLEGLLRRFPQSQKIRERLSALGAPAAAGTGGGEDDGIQFFEEAIRAPQKEAVATESAPFGTAGVEEADDSIFEQESAFFDEAAGSSAPLGAPAVAASREDSLEAIFEEFKKGVEAQVESEDYETHYNLGIAYREMGLIDEAIAEFQLAAKDANRFVDCCTNLGVCFRDKGMPKLAVKWYSKALDQMEIGSPQSIGVLYDLGEALEEAGDREGALEKFTDVFGLDSSYRDVNEKLRKLEEGE